MKGVKNNHEAEMSYYSLYLKAYFEDSPGDDNLNHPDFIEPRADSAAEEFERMRRDGYSVGRAQESAISVLLEGVARNKPVFLW